MQDYVPLAFVPFWAEFDIMIQTVYVQNFIFHLYLNKLQLLYKVMGDQPR